MSVGSVLPLAIELPTLKPFRAARRRPGAPRALGAVLAEAEMGEVTVFQIAGGTAAVFTTRSPKKETPNEDVAGLLPVNETTAILAVADGLGGHAGGEKASRLALETLQQTLHAGATLAPESSDWVRGAILDGIEAANDRVRSLGTGAATTLALVEIQNGVIRPYHVGDSAILLTGQRGKLKMQTIAHSPIGYAVEAGLMREEEAIHHEERHVISNVIGSDQMRIEIGPPVEMARRDTLVLASDGLLDNLLPSEIVGYVRSGPLESSVRALVDEALRRMNAEEGQAPSKPDDLTVIAYRPS